MCFSSDNSAKRIAEQGRADEVARQGRIASGMGQIDEAFKGFDDSYYAKRAKDYVDYATPELERQTTKARENLIYALSRTGNLDSSAAINKDNDLTLEANKQRIGVADQGLTLANQARSQVENTRSNLVGELNATGDSSASAMSAIRQAQNLNSPQGYSPLGSLFADFASAAAAIGSNASNGYSGFTGGKSLFGGSANGSQRVVGH